MNLKSKIALAVLALTAGTTAFAQVAYNVGVVSEYRYRGVAQSQGDPALQGGVDYAHSSGLYVGAWGSTISWIKANGKDGNVELDLYGGYKGTVGPVGYDVGYLRYEYVGNKLKELGGTWVNPNTDEAYLGLSYGPVTFKYSYAFSPLFGLADSKGSTYADLSATFDLGKGFSVTPHVGAQDIKGRNSAGLSYLDYSLTLTKDFGSGYSASISAISVDADNESLYVLGGQRTAKDQVIVGVKYTF